MKRSKFTEDPVAYVLRQAESGAAVEDVHRSIGISHTHFYIWKKGYGDLGACANSMSRIRDSKDWLQI